MPVGVAAVDGLRRLLMRLATLFRCAILGMSVRGLRQWW